MLTSSHKDGRLFLEISGGLDSQTAGDAERQLSQILFDNVQALTIDLGKLTALDTTGAWLIEKARRKAKQSIADIRIENGRPQHLELLDYVSRTYRDCDVSPVEQPVLVRLLVETGENTYRLLGLLGALLAFLYSLTITLIVSFSRPGAIQWRSVIRQVETIGTRSIPIVGLIAFLIGGVLVNQSADQLRQFGAEIFVVDLLAIAVFRELGVLLTAIMVAGRSGSAFTAQIGSMKLNEEIDAMTVIGMNPMAALVLPRLLAFIIALPILTIFANCAALVGGVLMAWATLDISPSVFITRAGAALQGWTVWLGVIKAPIFATVVTVCGCFEGLMVGKNAVSLGQHTTRSVVESIFLVIVMDAMFAILFAAIGI